MLINAIFIYSINMSKNVKNSNFYSSNPIYFLYNYVIVQIDLSIKKLGDRRVTFDVLLLKYNYINE